MFQHTAARRRLEAIQDRQCRPVCFNTQPPEGGWLAFIISQVLNYLVSTHSRPKAAGASNILVFPFLVVSTHSRPKAAGPKINPFLFHFTFQHTAARRRLAIKLNVNGIYLFVSTHSRPKAAGLYFSLSSKILLVSTHSRPKAAGFLRLISLS